MPEIRVDITVCGVDLQAAVEYRITDRGGAATRDEPGWPMDFETTDFTLMGDGKVVECPRWLEEAVLNEADGRIFSAVEEAEL